MHPPPIRQVRVAGALVTDHRRRIFLQNRQDRLRGHPPQDKTAAVGYGRHRAVSQREQELLPWRRGRDPGVRCLEPREFQCPADVFE